MAATVFKANPEYFGISLMTILIVILVILAIIYVLKPGTIGIPTASSMYALGETPQETFCKLREHYGECFQINATSQTIVVLNGYSIINETLGEKNKYFAGRPWWVLQRLRGNMGLSSSQDLPDTYNLVRESMMNEQLIPKFENEIKEELKLLVESMIDENGQKFDPFHHVHIFTTNIACYMCFGKRFEHTNPAFSELVLALREFMKAYIGSTMLNFQPLMWYLPIQKVKSLRTSHAKLITAISKLNDENLSHDEPQDMEFSYQMVDLIINCSETVCATILWTIVHMAQNRHVQEQVQQEIGITLKTGNALSFSNSSQMSYTEASILESQRLACVLPLAWPHSVIHDVEFRDFIVPKGTPVLINIMSSHLDKDYWINPEEFDPERFLNVNGEIKSRLGFLPYSLGASSCPGERLAKLELFMCFATLMKSFSFCLDDSGAENDVKCKPGLISYPAEFKITATKRK